MVKKPERIAITALVGEFDHFVDETNQMTLSGENLDNRFTFVLFVEPTVINKIKKRHNVNIYPYKSKGDYYNIYRYAKSLEFVEENKYVLRNYDYVIKTDTDVFFSEHLNSHTFDDKFYMGKGSYKFNCVEEMEKISKFLNVNNYKSYIEPNSTVIGPTDDVINFMKLTDKFCKKIFYYLSPDGDLSKLHNKWGKSLYAGTSTLIAQEIALVSQWDESKTIITNKLDADCTSQKNINEVYHVHQWHTDSMYSKFKARNKEYDNLEYVNNSAISAYCLNIFLKNKREIYE